MVFSILSGLFMFHAYYISFTEMEYNDETKSVEVSVKLTAHDLDKELESIYKVDIRLDEQSDKNQETLQNYLEEAFQLIQGKSKLAPILDGYEYDLSGDLYLFFHFSKFKKSKDFELKNHILFLNFPEQQNIVSFKIGEKKFEKTLTIKDNTLTSDNI